MIGSDFLAGIRALIIDMDGVLWRADQPIGDLPLIFKELQARPWRFLLATNNSTRTIDQYLEKLQSFGVSLEPWQVITSAQATAHFMKERYPNGGPVYIMGEAGLFQGLDEFGFYHGTEAPLAVVVGMDRQCTYDKLAKAALLIRSGLPWIATNPDRTFPTPYGLTPGTGAILAALEAATDATPTVIGKPSPEMFRVALQRLETAPDATLVVGDRPETDIAGAQALGCHTALLLSGVTSEAKARQWKPAPDWIAPDLAALLEMS